MDESVSQFIGITGANDVAARQVLEMCGGDVEQAIQLWFNDDELQRSLSTTAAAPSSVPTAGSGSRPNRTIGREDTNGVIHIDSDEDEDMDEDVGDIDDDTMAAQAAAQAAQEDEDAAMAQRLQDELYGAQAATGEEGVRAPMARTTETLVAPSGLYEDEDDVNMAMLQQMRQRRQMQARSQNPFGQSIWDDPSASAAPFLPGTAANATQQRAAPANRAQRLAELFRPPYDLMAHLSWDEAREEGKSEKKWILVNLQNMSDFNCQALNRDLWKDEAIRDLVKENFLFLQYDKNGGTGEQYVAFYFPNAQHENPDNYPHVGIVDPRTGEQVKTWSGLPFPSAPEFHAQLVEFLDRYSLDAKSKNPVVKAKRAETTVDFARLTEDEMLEMALKNSMDANGAGSKSNVQDPDELTKAESSKGKEVAMGDTEEEATPESAFAKIASDQPHTEPANDPTTTTRIQFRHPTGRVIRRFALNDTVERVYEWLKAEPLEGKEGVPFELKVMPQGRDLLEDLHKTLSEAGLKQATVMIEFIEA